MAMLYQIALFVALISMPLIALANTGASASVTPMGIHFAYTGNATEMTISWMTMGEAPSIVRYGLDPSELKFNATGSTVTYDEKLGFQHHTTLRGLALHSTYHFSVGSNSSSGNSSSWSSVYSFATPPAEVTPAYIPIFGDLGPVNSNGTRKSLIAYLEKNPVDFIYHIGDISYANDYPWEQYESVFNDYFETMQPVMTKVPYMTCPGNHERNGGNGSKWNDFHAYNLRFRMPRNPHNSDSNMFFSWNYKNIHFISLNTETDFPGAPEGKYASFGDQIKWLEEDLASVDRREYPWLIVVGHRPIYSSTTGQTSPNCKAPDGAALALQKAVEELFAKYKVDFYFCGHVHSYERDYPIYKNVAYKNYTDHSVMNNPPHTIYILAGAGGSVEGKTTKSSYCESGWYTTYYVDDYGFGVLSVLNNSTVEWNYYRSGDGGLQDKLTVTKT